MSELLRLTLLIVMGGVALTLFAAAAARYLAEENRLARTFRKGLGTRPDAALVAHGTGRGVAISLAAGRIVTAWDAGAWRMDYPLDDLLGAEIDLDGQVAGRVLRGEARRRLDRTAAERDVRLRLLFDDASYPDFELTLWPSRAGRRAPASPRDAVAEANRWLARVEAVLKRTRGSLVRAEVAPTHRRARPDAPPDPDLFEEDEEELAD